MTVLSSYWHVSVYLTTTEFISDIFSQPFLIVLLRYQIDRIFLYKNVLSHSIFSDMATICIIYTIYVSRYVIFVLGRNKWKVPMVNKKFVSDLAVLVVGQASDLYFPRYHNCSATRPIKTPATLHPPRPPPTFYLSLLLKQLSYPCFAILRHPRGVLSIISPNNICMCVNMAQHFHTFET